MSEGRRGEKIKRKRALHNYTSYNNASYTTQNSLFHAAQQLETKIELSEELRVLELRFTHCLEDLACMEDLACTLSHSWQP